jgi:hypothetical protein
LNKSVEEGQQKQREVHQDIVVNVAYLDYEDSLVQIMSNPKTSEFFYALYELQYYLLAAAIVATASPDLSKSITVHIPITNAHELLPEGYYPLNFIGCLVGPVIYHHSLLKRPPREEPTRNFFTDLTKYIINYFIEHWS